MDPSTSTRPPVPNACAGPIAAYSTVVLGDLFTAMDVSSRGKSVGHVLRRLTLVQLHQYAEILHEPFTRGGVIRQRQEQRRRPVARMLSVRERVRAARSAVVDAEVPVRGRVYHRPDRLRIVVAKHHAAWDDLPSWSCRAMAPMRASTDGSHVSPSGSGRSGLIRASWPGLVTSVDLHSWRGGAMLTIYQSSIPWRVPTQTPSRERRTGVGQP